MLSLCKDTTACLKNTCSVSIKLEKIVGPVHLRLDPSQLSCLGHLEAVLFE